MVKARRAKDDLPVEQETQQHPKENSHKKPPSGWRYYSPADRSGWPPGRRQVLATIAIVVTLVSLSLISYFFQWWPVAGQPAFVVGGAVTFLVAAITLIGISHRKATWLPTQVWKAIRGNAALAGGIAALLAAVIGLGGVFYQQRVASDIADQQRQDEAVQTYFDDIGDLLLDTDQPLREAQLGDDVSVMAQAKTLTLLEALDSNYKKSIVQFLYNARLIRKVAPVVSLSDANLRDANLARADLREANLRGANLSYAPLFGANLRDANLARADLSGADLSNATVTDEQLAEVETLERATMPDGTIHN